MKHASVLLITDSVDHTQLLKDATSLLSRWQIKSSYQVFSSWLTANEMSEALSSFEKEGPLAVIVIASRPQLLGVQIAATCDLPLLGVGIEKSEESASSSEFGPTMASFGTGIEGVTRACWHALQIHALTTAEAAVTLKKQREIWKAQALEANLGFTTSEK